MRRLHMDRGQGILKLQVDTLDDLWTLRNLIGTGDLVTASTTRTPELAGDKLRPEKVEKKRMTLGVRVEGVEWHGFADHLRVLGTIESGPQDIGNHHTLVFKDDYGTKLTLQKRDGRIHNWQTDLIAEAEKATTSPQVLLLAIDDEGAQFGQLQSYGLRPLGMISAGGQGKRYAAKESGAAKKRFYDEVLESVKSFRADPKVAFLVVGPGWWREEFIEHATAKASAVMQDVRTDGTSQAGIAGLREALQRGVVAQVARDHRVHTETERVDTLYGHMGKDDGLAAYGPDEVEAAVIAGAAEEVLLTDLAVRENSHPKVVTAAETNRTTVHIVSTDHDAGARLHQLGGVAANLRFPVT
jgi:protein pelota